MIVLVPGLFASLAAAALLLHARRRHRLPTTRPCTLQTLLSETGGRVDIPPTLVAAAALPAIALGVAAQAALAPLDWPIRIGLALLVTAGAFKLWLLAALTGLVLCARCIRVDRAPSNTRGSSSS